MNSRLSSYITLTTGYLQHGSGNGPFITERVTVKQDGSWPNANDWYAFYEGKWRKVHIQVNRLYIVYMGDKITIQIEGV